MGLVHHSEGVAGINTRTVWGMEVGNLMDAKQASYLKGGISNWQKGFGVLWVEGKKVTPQLVPINQDGSFSFLGKVWK